MFGATGSQKPAGPALGRKERARSARRQDILVAARRIFGQRGYESATLDEIAERAEYAKGTLYNYFDTKEAIFREIVMSILKDVEQIAEFAAAAGGDARTVLSRYAIDTIEYLKANDDILRILAVEVYRVQLHDHHGYVNEVLRRVSGIASIIARPLQEEIRKNRIVTENPEELANLFMWIVHHRCIRRFFQERTIQTMDSREEALFVTRLFFEGAAVDPEKGVGRA